MAPCRKIYDEVVKEKTSESISKGQLVATYVSLIKSLVGGASSGYSVLLVSRD